MFEKRKVGRPKIQDLIGMEISNENAKYRDKTALYLARLRYDLRRLEKGLCAWPACPNNGPGYCAEHKRLRNAKAVERRKKRVNGVVKLKGGSK